MIHQSTPEVTPLVQRLLFAFVVLGMVGALAELLLLEHVEEFWQRVPVAALAVGLVAAGARVLRPARWSRWLFQGVMLGLVVIGGLGFWQHYASNVEFEREMSESISGMDLFWASMQGAMPALAPLALTHLGLLGLLTGFRGRSGEGQGE